MPANIEIIIKSKPEADSIKRACNECYHCRGYVNLWCTNEEAIDYRHTLIPDTANCNFWKAARHYKELNFIDKFLNKLAIFYIYV